MGYDIYICFFFREISGQNTPLGEARTSRRLAQLRLFLQLALGIFLVLRGGHRFLFFLGFVNGCNWALDGT